MHRALRACSRFSACEERIVVPGVLLLLLSMAGWYGAYSDMFVECVCGVCVANVLSVRRRKGLKSCNGSDARRERGRSESSACAAHAKGIAQHPAAAAVVTANGGKRASGVGQKTAASPPTR